MLARTEDLLDSNYLRVKDDGVPEVGVLTSQFDRVLIPPKFGVNLCVRRLQSLSARGVRDGLRGIVELRRAKPMTISAKYEDGVFRPLDNVTIREGTMVEVRLPAVDEQPNNRPSIKEIAFYGMWADRDDISDGLELRQ